MKRRLLSSIFPLLILVLTGSACSLSSNLAARLEETPEPTSPLRQYVVLPPILTSDTVVELPLSELPVAGQPPVRRPRPTATPTAASSLAVISQLFNAPTATPTRAWRLAALPTVPPTPTGTATPSPTFTPTDTPLPTFTPIPTDTPWPTDTPLPTLPPTFTPAPPPAATPTPAPPTPTPQPEYDFLVGEFYNSPTTNPFLVIYVAIVDVNEIPIGDMKVVGTRQDHNLTYSSPLSTWYFEGYNAPGEVIKSGNVKFEPPGGIETTAWVLHLEDANGKRLSDDIPFNTDPNDKQWYFIKLKRKF